MQYFSWDLLVFRFLVIIFGCIGRRGDTEARQSGSTFSLTGGSSTVGPRPRGVLTPALIPSSPNQCCTVVPSPLHTDRGLPWCLLCWVQVQGLYLICVEHTSRSSENSNDYWRKEGLEEKTNWSIHSFDSSFL